MGVEEFFKVKRWEGKPWLFKMKYMYANYPEVAITIAMSVVGTFMLIYRQMTFEGSRYDSIKKYKSEYIVVRDDDPDLPRIIAEKEKGRENFPKY